MCGNPMTDIPGFRSSVSDHILGFPHRLISIKHIKVPNSC